MKTLRLSPVVLWFVAGCQVQASCGSKKLRMDEASEWVSSLMEKHVGERPAKVTCPESVKPEANKTFECTAELGVATATVVLRQKDDRGNVVLESSRGAVFAQVAEEAIAKGIGEKANVHAKVDCGPRVRAARPGETFTCKATDARGVTVTVEVAIKDADGNIHWRIAANP